MCPIVAAAVRDIVQTCWNRWLSNRRFWRRCNTSWKVSITLRYQTWLIVTLTPCSWNHREPSMPLALKAHHAVHLSLWRGRSLTSFGSFLPIFCSSDSWQLHLNKSTSSSRCLFLFLVETVGTLLILLLCLHYWAAVLCGIYMELILNHFTVLLIEMSTSCLMSEHVFDNFSCGLQWLSAWHLQYFQQGGTR